MTRGTVEGCVPFPSDRELRKRHYRPDVDRTSTRHDLLRLAWAGVRTWTPAKIADLPAAQRAVAAGADPGDVALAMNAAAYEAIFNLLAVLDEGADPHSDDEAEGRWAVVAVPSCNQLVGLHEDVLTADPTGRAGADLFA